MSHPKAVPRIQLASPAVEFWRKLLHVPEPKGSDLLTLAPSVLPNLLEVIGTYVVLCHCNGILDVQHAMPPLTGHEDNVTGPLQSFIDSKVWVSLLCEGG